MTKESTAVVTAQPKTAVDLFKQPNVRERFVEIMGKRGNAFTSSVLTLVSQNEKLKKCDPQSIYLCAMMAATLNLPVNANLGFAYIIPYGDKAQFQMGYKGFIQLAMRSGQFKTISSAPIYKDQIVSQNPLKGFEFDFTVLPGKDEKPVGYAAYIELMNGFNKTLYMTTQEVTAHGKKYSKTFNTGPWKDDFETMALKTVMKLLLSKYAPLSVEMEQAVTADQGTINEINTDGTVVVEYPDAGKEVITLEMLEEAFKEKQKHLNGDEHVNIERIIKNKEQESYEKAYQLIQSK